MQFYATKNAVCLALLAAICGILSIKYSFYSGNIETTEHLANFQYLTASFNIWILIITVALVCVAAIDIFLYKNRKMQSRLAILGILLSDRQYFPLPQRNPPIHRTSGKPYHYFDIRFCNSDIIFSRCSRYIQRSETRKKPRQTEIGKCESVRV